MKNDSKLQWIKAGYKLFSGDGPYGLKIEVMGRKIKKNKSSFYHYFADLEVFVEELLSYHIKRAKIIAKMESECKNIVPELLNVLLEFKEDLLFSRQLRINRNNIQFKNCFEKSNKIVGDAIVDIWAEAIGLKDNSYLANIILKLSLDNFYLQITEDTLTYEWLISYINEYQFMVNEFQKNERNKSN